MASEYRKRVEGPLWQWIETRGCRRDIADEYFGCPSWTRKGMTSGHRSQYDLLTAVSSNWCMLRQLQHRACS
jgi:hypothetical protein